MKAYNQLPEDQQKKYFGMYKDQIKKTHLLMMDFEPTNNQLNILADTYARSGMYHGGRIYPGIIMLGEIHEIVSDLNH